MRMVNQSVHGAAIILVLMTSVVTVMGDGTTATVACPDNCMNCLREVLASDGKWKFKPDDGRCGQGCQRINHKNCGCGPYAITKAYYKKCKKVTTLPKIGYKKCVFDESCARQCVCHFTIINTCQSLSCADLAQAHFIKGMKGKQKLCKLKKSLSFRKGVIKCLATDKVSDVVTTEKVTAPTPTTATTQPICNPLVLQPYSTSNPGDQWGNNADLQNTFPPFRTGFSAPYPTHHFSVNQAKKLMVPIVLFPYIAVISKDGVTYDAQPLDRWSDPKREMLKQQATPNFNTWLKFPDVGTNTEQIVTGPDGNPFAIFSGYSGIRVGMTQDTLDPVWEEHGELYANWKIEEQNKNGSLEIPLVRGSALLTHIFTNADPLIKPFCLTSVNGVNVPKFDCPWERSYIDVGAGFLNGSYCSDEKLHIILRMTKPRAISEIQWAANSVEGWSSSHLMHPCGPECVSSDGGKRIDITVDVTPGQTGEIAFAINNIGYYTIPSLWIDNPATTTCTSDRRKRAVSEQREEGDNENEAKNRKKRETSIASGDKFNLELDEPGTKLPDQTRKFVLFFSETVNVEYGAQGMVFTSTSGGRFSGIVRVGYLGVGPRGDTSMDNFLDPYRHAYSLNPSVNYCVSGDSGTVEFDWNKQGTGPLLMNVLPHQNDMLDGTNLIDTPSVFKGYIGDKWSLVYSLPPASLMPDPSAVTDIKTNPKQLQDILDGLAYDSTTGLVITWSCDVRNSYFAGKDIAMAARAASISRAFDTEHYKTFDPAIKTCLEKWLRITDTLPAIKHLHYDTVWGGLMMTDQGSFGFDKYNDHHFHLGYWIYAIAYYSKYYTEFATSYKEEILYLARDVGNPSTADTYFPLVRHKDIFLGHSWASGIHIAPRDQESSSEAINGYHALAALGESLSAIDGKYKLMRDFGRIMLAMEIKSTRQYYHVRDSNFDQFPPLIQKFGSIGMFSEHALYRHDLHFDCGSPNVFPSRHGCLRGIQVLPVTAVSNYFMDEGWAKHVNQTCQWAINPSSVPHADQIDPALLVPTGLGWGVLCLLASSAASPAVNQQAIDFVHSTAQSAAFEGGSGYASSLLFLYGRT